MEFKKWVILSYCLMCISISAVAESRPAPPYEMPYSNTWNLIPISAEEVIIDLTNHLDSHPKDVDVHFMLARAYISLAWSSTMYLEVHENTSPQRDPTKHRYHVYKFPYSRVTQEKLFAYWAKQDIDRDWVGKYQDTTEDKKKYALAVQERVNTLRKSIHLPKTSPKAHMDYAEKSVEQYIKILEIVPENAHAYYELASLVLSVKRNHKSNPKADLPTLFTKFSKEKLQDYLYLAFEYSHEEELQLFRLNKPNPNGVAGLAGGWYISLMEDKDWDDQTKRSNAGKIRTYSKTLNDIDKSRNK